MTSMQLCGHKIGEREPFFLIAGPCVIETEQLAIDTAGTLKEMAASLDIPFIFKSSLIFNSFSFFMLQIYDLRY